jgi:hypothetical protein
MPAAFINIYSYHWAVPLLLPFQLLFYCTRLQDYFILMIVHRRQLLALHTMSIIKIQYHVTT